VKLQEFEIRKLEGGRGIRSRAKWRLFGDCLSIDFFKVDREAPTMTLITKLKDCQGLIHQEKEDLEQIYIEFYIKLHAKEIPSSQMLAGQQGGNPEL